MGRAGARIEAETVQAPPDTRLLVMPQDVGRVTVLALAAAPEGSRWLLRRQGSTWQALLRLPPVKEADNHSVSVQVWAPFRDEPGLLKELVSFGKTP